MFRLFLNLVLTRRTADELQSALAYILIRAAYKHLVSDINMIIDTLGMLTRCCIYSSFVSLSICLFIICYALISLGLLFNFTYV
jgi:hypothetical protein